MNQPAEMGQAITSPKTKQPTKKLYHKPGFRFEHVFETRALSCGKISTTQSQCAHDTKSS